MFIAYAKLSNNNCTCMVFTIAKWCVYKAFFTIAMWCVYKPFFTITMWSVYKPFLLLQCGCIKPFLLLQCGVYISLFYYCNVVCI